MFLFRGAAARAAGAASLLLACVAMESGCSSQGAIPAPGTSGALARAPQLAAASARADAVVATVPSLQSLGVRDEGPAPATDALHLVVTLGIRNEAKLDRLIAEQTNKGSAQYRHWLSNDAFKQSFAPAEGDYRRVVAALQGAGFHVDTTYDNRTVVDVTATVAGAERFFKTTIHRVRQSGQDRVYANVRPAYAPSELAGLIVSVDGLNTIVVVRSEHVPVARGARPAIQPMAGSNALLFGPISQATGARGYGPLAFTAGYDLPIRHKNAKGKPYDGLGRASGIVIDADFAESDLRTFLTYFKIARTGPATKRILLQGGPPQGDAAADSLEAALDAEALVGDAPGTALSVYEIPKLSNGAITDAYNRVASDNKVDTVNSSFGGCEALLGAKTMKAWTVIFKQAVAKGITFHASTGDGGGGLCANAPASSPYVVAVGGTALTVGTGGAWASEAAWIGGGGGISTMFALPAWQAGVAGTVSRGRNSPDVALDADPYSGFALYFTGSWNTQFNPIGGTSLSSPIFGAAVTEIDQMNDGRAGLIGSSLYGILKNQGYGSGASANFHDITQGNNGVYYAAPGYDLSTGIGSIDAFNIGGLL
ncbi:MAG TPA: S53 family peptidase [Candidatus Acidoferrales bacterium]|jgi:kumamolisin|nr:S53 family peptidase [Candidatus Acidoferrales bacterium]